MPVATAYGLGRRSAYMPTNGCSNAPVSCSTSVMSPICPKSSAKFRLRMGYRAVNSDCIMSFNRWQKLRAARISNAGLTKADAAPVETVPAGCPSIAGESISAADRSDKKSGLVFNGTEVDWDGGRLLIELPRMVRTPQGYRHYFPPT